MKQHNSFSTVHHCRSSHRKSIHLLQLHQLHWKLNSTASSVSLVAFLKPSHRRHFQIFSHIIHTLIIHITVTRQLRVVISAGASSTLLGSVLMRSSISNLGSASITWKGR